MVILCELVAVECPTSVMADKERTARVGRPRLPGSAKEDVSPIPRCFAAILSSLVTVKRAFYGIEANFH